VEQAGTRFFCDAALCRIPPQPRLSDRGPKPLSLRARLGAVRNDGARTRTDVERFFESVLSLPEHEPAGRAVA
jgi:hypothetical protein